MEENKIIIEELKNSGLVLEPPSFENYHAELGDAIGTASPLTPPEIMFPTGYGWKQVNEEYGHPEIQFNRLFDTFSCVIFGIAKALCLDTFKRYGIRITVSEMFNAVMAGVVPNRGTTIEKGMESFRKNGWVEDVDYPFTAETTAKQFFSYPPKSIVLKAKGKLTEWDFHWEVLKTDLKSIFEAYKRTPVVLTGFAWASYYGTGVYYDYNNPANHCFVGLEPIRENNLISDTYPKDFKYVENSQINVDALMKELDKTFKYGSAHRCWLTPKTIKKLTLKDMFTKICRDIHGGFWFVKDKKKAPINTLPAFIGAVVDEIGCKTLKEEELNNLQDYPFFGNN